MARLNGETGGAETSKLHIAKLQYVICLYKVLKESQQNCRRSLQHEITSILYTDRYTDGQT